MDGKWGFEPQGVGGKLVGVGNAAVVQVIRPMTCIHGRATGTNHFFPDRPVDEKWGFEPQGVGGKWLVSVVRSVASKATVDAGHPIHDQRRWQVVAWFNFISFNV